MSDSARMAPDGGQPFTTAVVEDYFARLAAAAVATGTPIGPDELAELRAHVNDRLEATAGTASDATAVLAELGSPAMLAAAFAAAAPEDDGEPRTDSRRTAMLAGSILGIPYDVRPPSSGRYASRLWDPTNPRILVPRLLGVGWTVNFGALAVKAHLVRPDDEDIPFATVPERAVTATLAAPIAVVVALGSLVAVRWSSLPPVVPTHWGLDGRPDGYGSPGSAVLLVGALAVVPLLFAAGVHARRRRSFNRVTASALSLAFAGLSFAIFAQTLLTVDGGSEAWPIWVGIAGFVVLPLLLLVGVSRLGRAAEQRRDLSESKGRAT